MGCAHSSSPSFDQLESRLALSIRATTVSSIGQDPSCTASSGLVRFHGELQEGWGKVRFRTAIMSLLNCHDRLTNNIQNGIIS